MNSKKYFAICFVIGLCFCFFIYGSSINCGRPFNYKYVQKVSQLFKNRSSAKSNTLSKYVNIVKYEKVVHNFVKGVLQYEGKKMDLYVHGSHDYISGEILNNGIWEKGWIDQFVRYIKENPGIQVLDVGCNLGVYAMMAASMDCKVIAIDANKNNTDLLAQSVILANFTNKITIILNAVSNERKLFFISSVPENIGGQWLITKSNDTYQVQSIFLDDVLPLIDNKRNAMMKIDIEGFEVSAMKSAGNLFDKTNIKLIFMEWFQAKILPDSYSIMNFFLSRNYSAYSDFYSTTVLDISNYKAWPYEIVWRRP